MQNELSTKRVRILKKENILFKKMWVNYFLLCLISTFFIFKPAWAVEKAFSLTDSPSSLADAVKVVKTKLTPSPFESEHEAPPKPPAGIFQLVQYPAAPGMLAAYITPVKLDGVKHPAIVWVTGGDANSIGDVWSLRPAKNDQSVSAFRKAGVVVMFPSLRGGNNNPGKREGFLGEVDDILAAAAFLRQRPDVDPSQIYLGGHSTGGTLALLTAERSNIFKAVFSFGPIDEIDSYPSQYLPFKLSKQEIEIRSPLFWLKDVRSPTYVIEGVDGNQENLTNMKKKSGNSKLSFSLIPGHDHFSVLTPMTSIIAQEIIAQTSKSRDKEFSIQRLK